MIKLSVLDQSPISDGSTAAQAFSHTVTLAQEVEKLGFTHFWVSEHHNSVSLAGSSPEILISHIAAKRTVLESVQVVLCYRIIAHIKLLRISVF
ncbi:LLM class flavin-dependent oxidoreductase [Bacillus thuringiensis]